MSVLHSRWRAPCCQWSPFCAPRTQTLLLHAAKSWWNWVRVHALPVSERPPSMTRWFAFSSLFTTTGCTAMEVTVDTVDFPRVVRELVAAVGDRCCIGCGTAMTLDDVSVEPAFRDVCTAAGSPSAASVGVP